MWLPETGGGGGGPSGDLPPALQGGPALSASAQPAESQSVRAGGHHSLQQGTNLHLHPHLQQAEKEDEEETENEET